MGMKKCLQKKENDFDVPILNGVSKRNPLWERLWGGKKEDKSPFGGTLGAKKPQGHMGE